MIKNIFDENIKSNCTQKACKLGMKNKGKSKGTWVCHENYVCNLRNLKDPFKTSKPAAIKVFTMNLLHCHPVLLTVFFRVTELMQSLEFHFIF